MSTTRSGSARSRPAKRSPASTPGKGLPIWPFLGGALVVAAIIAIVLSMGGGDDDGGDTATDNETATVQVEGTPLPRFVPGEEDDAIGDVAPTLQGSDFAGAPVTIPAGTGNAQAIFFVAHWCPHCQAEVPRLAEWIESHGVPAGLDIVMVSTNADPSLDNYPAAEWLAREGLGDLTTMVDDEEFTALQAYGAGRFPYVVYLDGEGKVALRTEGEYPDDPEAFTALFEDLAAGNAVSDPRQ